MCATPQAAAALAAASSAACLGIVVCCSVQQGLQVAQAFVLLQRQPAGTMVVACISHTAQHDAPSLVEGGVRGSSRIDIQGGAAGWSCTDHAWSINTAGQSLTFCIMSLGAASGGKVASGTGFILVVPLLRRPLVAPSFAAWPAASAGGEKHVGHEGAVFCRRGDEGVAPPLAGMRCNGVSDSAATANVPEPSALDLSSSTAPRTGSDWRLPVEPVHAKSSVWPTVRVGMCTSCCRAAPQRGIAEDMSSGVARLL
jgi:hypothetical protein